MRRIYLAVVALTAISLLSGCKTVEERVAEHISSAVELIQEGDSARAIVELRNALKLDEGQVEARRMLAQQLDEANSDYRGAYAQYLRIAEQFPEDLEARIRLAELAFLRGNWEEVERHGAQAEALDPDEPRVRAITIGRSYRAAALDQDEAKRRDLGREAAELLKTQPENMLLRNLLVDSALRDGENALALEQIDWLIERHPDTKSYWRQRLQIYAQTRDREALRQGLFDMVDRFPDDDEIKAALLRFLIADGDIDGAEAYLRSRVEAAEPDSPAQVGARVDVIRFLDQLRGPEAALAEVNAAIEGATDPAPYRLIGATLEFAQGKQEEGIATLEGILANADEDADPEFLRGARIALAKMLAQTGNTVGARARVEEVLAEAPSNAAALKMQAVWQIEADDPEAAIASLRLALDSKPEDAEAMSLMAQAYTRAGSPNLAREFLALAVDASGNAPAETIRYARLLIAEERYLPAEDILLPALRLAPENVDLLGVTGQLYLQMGDMGRVQQVSESLRRIGTPEAVSIADAIETERLNKQSGPDEAIAYLEQIASGQDATIGNKLSLVRARLAAGDAAGARELAKTLSEENPDNAGITFVLATTETVNGNFETAEALYRGLVEEDPARPSVWLELTRLASRRGEHEKAREIVDEGLGHSPEDANLLWAKASYLERDGDVDGAIGIYEKLYAQNSNLPIVANNLASLLSSARDDPESLERAWVIARRFSDAEVPALQDTYGWIAFRRGEPEEALPYLEAAAAGLAQDAVVQYHLARAFEALERTDEARAQYAKAISVAGPIDTRPQIEDARSRLASLGEAGTDK